MSRLYGAPFATIPEWVLDAEISDRAARLFGILSRHADREGRAFPGRRKLAERLRCSPASLDRAVAELVEIEAIATEASFRPDGGRSSNSYWLWPALPPRADEEGPSQDGAGALVTAEEGALVTGEEARNESQIDREQEDREPGNEDPFEIFWTSYPRRVAKGEARKAWPAALAKAGSAEIIIEGARRYASESRGVEARFVAHPASWLRAERWGDEPGANAQTGRPSGGSGPRGQIARPDGPEGRVTAL